MSKDFYVQRANHYLTDRRAAGNTGLAKVAVQCFVGQFCGYINLVLRMKVCAENRHLRQARNR